MTTAPHSLAATRRRPIAARTTDRASFGRRSPSALGHFLCLVLILLPACGPARAPATRPAHTLSAADPCAEHLQDLAGALLLYYSTHHAMPPAIKDLQPLSPSIKLVYECPASRQPYIYHPDGLSLTGVPGLVVVYDALPAHHGMRWALVAVPSEGDQLLTTRVLAVPNSSFPPPAKAPASNP